MAGLKGRSGRRRIETPHLDLPVLGDSEDSIRAHLEAVSAAVATGQLDCRIADTLVASAKASLRALEQKAKRGEVDELRAMVEAVKERFAAGRANQIADRQHTAVPKGPRATK